MKPEQVQRGNYVYYQNKIFEIDTISEEFPTLNTEEFGIGVVGWDDIKPVIINPNILLKLGFESQQKDIYVRHNHKRGWIHYVKSKGILNIGISNIDPNLIFECICSIKYLHELQIIFQMHKEQLKFIQ